MKFGLTSGILWGLDTVILGIGLAMAPFIGTAEALALGAIVGAALHWSVQHGSIILRRGII